MPKTPTPGQRAYEAYSAALPVRSGWTHAAWMSLDVVVQDAWEAAAQAVLTATYAAVPDIGRDPPAPSP